MKGQQPRSVEEEDAEFEERKSAAVRALEAMTPGP